MTIAPESDDQSLSVLREAFKEIYNDTVTDGWLIMDLTGYDFIAKFEKHAQTSNLYLYSPLENML